MRTYTFTARTAEGMPVSGRVRAAHLASARAELNAQDLSQLDVTEKVNRFRLDTTSKKVSKADVLSFTRHLQGYLSAGMPLLAAVNGMASDTQNPALRTVLHEVSTSLSSGVPLATALAEHPKVFSESYIAMIAAAEATNRIDEILEDVATHLEKDQENRSKLKSAATYPLIVVGMAVATILVLVVFALPKFADFFAGFDAELPVTTRIVLGIATLVQEWGWLMAVVAVVAVVAAFLFLRTVKGRVWRDRAILSVPAVHGIVRAAVVERFSRVLGSMLASGVPAPQALSLASDATNNRTYQKSLAGVREAVMQGEGIAGPLARTNLFPSNVCEVVNAGEKSGTLDMQLTRISAFYARESQHKMTRLTTFFEPVLLVVVGLVVGFVALAMVSAMYGIFGQMQ